MRLGQIIVPPVTKTWMPALAASSMVAETVVAPSNPFAMTNARSRRDTLHTLGPLRITPPQHHVLRIACNTNRCMLDALGKQLYNFRWCKSACISMFLMTKQQRIQHATRMSPSLSRCVCTVQGLCSSAAKGGERELSSAPGGKRLQLSICETDVRDAS